MSPEIIFSLQLVLGYVAWLLCFGVYIMPRLKAMDRVAAHRTIATLNSFRFFPGWGSRWIIRPSGPILSGSRWPRVIWDGPGMPRRRSPR